MLVRAVLPPAAGDLLAVLAVAGAALALDAVEDVLPVLQIADGAQQLLQIIAHLMLLDLSQRMMFGYCTLGSTLWVSRKDGG